MIDYDWVEDTERDDFIADMEQGIAKRLAQWVEDDDRSIKVAKQIRRRELATKVDMWRRRGRFIHIQKFFKGSSRSVYLTGRVSHMNPAFFVIGCPQKEVVYWDSVFAARCI